VLPEIRGRGLVSNSDPKWCFGNLGGGSYFLAEAFLAIIDEFGYVSQVF
jgi:hypothetical protein